MRYISGLEIGDLVASFKHDLRIEHRYYVGSKLFCTSLIPGDVIADVTAVSTKKRLASANGTYCITKNHDIEQNIILLILPSRQLKYISSNYICTIGRIGYEKSFMEIVGKAGLNRILGWRPTVRGVAMNPVDHPHGGRTKTNSPEKSP